MPVNAPPAHAGRRPECHTPGVPAIPAVPLQSRFRGVATAKCRPSTSRDWSSLGIDQRGQPIAAARLSRRLIARHGSAPSPAAATGGRYQQRRATFTALCAACPLRDRCTTAKTGCVVTIRPHHDLQAAARHQAAIDPAWQDDYRRWRPMVERAVAWLVARGNRRLRYRGTGANDRWLHHRTGSFGRSAGTRRARRRPTSSDGRSVVARSPRPCGPRRSPRVCCPIFGRRPSAVKPSTWRRASRSP
jgi:hypothetical protein